APLRAVARVQRADTAAVDFGRHHICESRSLICSPFLHRASANVCAPPPASAGPLKLAGDPPMKAFPSLAMAGLTAAVLAAFAVPARAQDQDSRFTLRLGAMNADGDATLHGSAASDELGERISGNVRQYT